MKINEARVTIIEPKKVTIFGVNVAIAEVERVLKIIDTRLKQKTYNKPYLIVTVNSELVMVAQTDDEFKWILNGADLAVADGAGLRLVVPELPIVKGRKIVEELVDNQSKAKWKIFYLGGRDGVATEMAAMFGGEADEGHDDIKSQISNVKSQINTNVIKKINKYKPDVLLVAYGAPWQEKWLEANRSKLKAKGGLGGGGAVDYLTGRSKLPPEWVATAGLEWLWRLVNEPWRWRRQLRLLKFMWLVIWKQK